MMKMTDEAASLIVSLLTETALPSSAGLRLRTDPHRGSLDMSLSAQPRKQDLVVDHGGALLFVTPAVAERLADTTLHAQIDDRPAFFLT